MKKLKKVIALFMAICTMATIVPTNAFASENTEPMEVVEELAEENGVETTEEVVNETIEEEVMEEPANEPVEEENTEEVEPVSTNSETVVEEIIESKNSKSVDDSSEDEIMTIETTIGMKPVSSTVSGEPFDETVSKNHRIPGIVTLNDGTLVASADARWNNEKDGGGLDVVVSKSDDDGATWDYTFAAYLGDNGNVYNPSSSTLMDPLIVTDGEDLYLLSDIFPAGYAIGTTGSTTNGFSATGTGFDANGRLRIGTTYTSTNCAYYLENGLICDSITNEAVEGYTVDAWFNVYNNGTYVSNLFFADSPYVIYPTSYICMQTYDERNGWSAPEILNVKKEGTSWQVLGPGSGLITSAGEIAFTAYDGSSIYLIHGTSGDWKVVNTAAATNESSIVELSDGTIRAFVKNNNNKITYVDFVPNGDTYIAGTAISTSVANTGWCMVSSLKYSKMINGQEAIFVCCPTDLNNGSVRCNGTISVFLLDENKNMSLLTSYQVNSDFFAYSDMTEINNGQNIALLYEDGCNYYTSGSNGVGYSHIKYVKLGIEEILKDVEGYTIGENKTVTDEATGITVTALELASVNAQKLDESTPAEGYNKSVTYRIELYDSNGDLYTGKATVKVPAGDLARCQKYKGTVDGEEFKVNAPVDGFFTLEVPHFSDVTISGYALDPETVNITLYKGSSETVKIDGVAYFDSNITTRPNSTYATIESVTGTTNSAKKELVAVTAIESGKQYLLHNNRAGELLTDESYTSGDATWLGTLTGLKVTGKASIDSTELWTISASGDGYNITQNGKYLTFDNKSAEMSDSSAVLSLNYYKGDGWLIQNSAGYYLSDLAGNTLEGAFGFIDSSRAGDYWTIYEIVDTEAETYTNITFLGISKGTTTATIGHVTYNITVKDVVEGDLTEFNNIVGVDSYVDGNALLDMSGKPIKVLTISAGATFDLGVDIADCDDIIWSSGDETIATVDDNGKVSVLKSGETQVTATVVKNGVKESISIDINAKDSLLQEGDESAEVAIYIAEERNAQSYYTLYHSRNGSEPLYKLIPVEEGEMIYLLRPTGQEFGLVFTSAQDEGYILTYMSATDSQGQYYPLQDGDGNLQTGNINGVQYYAGSEGYNNLNNSESGFGDTLDVVLGEAVTTYNCFGGQSFSRGRTTKTGEIDTSGVITSLSFIAERVPQMSKVVQGILPPEGVQANFKPYVEGMVAAVKDQVYFKITITLERPVTWQTGENADKSALIFDNAILTDQLDGAFFYTKELDLEDDKWDGIVPEESQKNVVNITEDLNKAWEADEEIRNLEYYVIYEIEEKDIPTYVISNNVHLDYSYKSTYSAGKYASNADAKAQITVVREAIDAPVIDFGKQITINGLDNKTMKFAFPGDETSGHHAKYGNVVIEREQLKDVNGNGLVDGNGYPQYNYTVTYTPNKILQEPEIISIWGEYDENDVKEQRMINSLTIYPATTMHYEESFIDWDANWEVIPGSVGTQEYQKLGENSEDSEKFQHYGYDKSYENNLGDSNGTYAKASKIGAQGTFTFTGTGLDVYAKCTPDTGSVYVQLKNSGGKSVGLYIVDTVAKNGTSDATSGQENTLYGMPIVSVRNLKHDTYTVTIRKCMNTRPVYIDGIRVYGTIEDSVKFKDDYEDYPEFYEMRDVVLHAMNVSDITSKKYESLEEMAMQIYSGISEDTEQPAIILNDNPSFKDVDVQDLLDNGPKNELFLRKNNSLVFKVKTSRLMQIGMKAPTGSTKYSLSYTCKDANGKITEVNGSVTELSTSVDMFYRLVNENVTDGEYTVTITNNADNILSVTDLKICDDPNAAFSSLTEKDIEYALKAMGYSDPETPVKELTITKQPSNGEAKLGERYMVEVQAEGEGLKYQWYFRKAGATKWSKSGVTDNTYDDVMTKARADREVYCVITDANGNKVTTDIVKLICIPGEELAIVKQPVNGEAVLGERYCVTVEAKGEGLKYQWYFRKPGAERWTKSSVTDNTYDDVMTKARADREVYCVITDANGNKVTTDIAKLICIPGEELAIVKQPVDGEAVLGERYCVTVEAKGEGLKYQWYFRKPGAERWTKSSVTDNTYDDVLTKSRIGREVYCLITDASGNKISTDIVELVRVPMKLEIVSQPADASASFGENFCAEVKAKGEGLKYQWYFRKAGSEKWSKSGVRDNTYDDVMTKARANREVYCVITDKWGNSVTTDIVKLMPVAQVELKLLGQTYESAAMGERYCITVDAQGEDLKYQWYFRNEGSEKWSKSGVRDNTYDDVMNKSRANREVYCVITDACGNQIVTETVTLTVKK